MAEAQSTAIPASVTACYLSLDKAIKTLNLYMGKGDLSEASIDQMHASVKAHLEDNADLTIQITSEGLQYKGSQLDVGDRTTHYYFHLFKDGLREVTFLPGLLREEVAGFLRVLLEQQLENLNLLEEGQDEGVWLGDIRDHDAVTRLWEADFKHMRYHAIDAYAEGEIFDPAKGFSRSLADQVLERMARFRPLNMVGTGQAVSPADAKPPEELKKRGAMKIVGSQMPPDEHRKAWRSMVTEDEKLAMDRFAVVWGRLVRSAGPQDTERLAGLMVQMFRDWFEEGNFDALIRALKVLLALGKTGENKAVVHFVFTEVGRPTELNRLLPVIEEIDPDNAVKCVVFHKALGEAAVGTLSKMLVDLPAGHRIQAFERAFSNRGLSPSLIHLARLKSDEQGNVLVAIENLSGFLQLPGVRDALRGLLGRQDTRVRHTALRALRGDDDPYTLKAMARALDDFDKHMRVFAAEQLVATGKDFARDALLDRVISKEFRGLDQVERHSLLSGLASLGGEDAEDYFYDQLERRTFLGLGRAKLEAFQDELRAALADANTPASLSILKEMS